MKSILFVVCNHHLGNGPEIFNGDDGRYYSYFENEHGEQWIFTYDKLKRVARVYGGDMAWQELKTKDFKDLILNTPERLWLDACLHAIGAGGLEDYLPHFM